jgi:hypothetical protein
MAGIKIQTVGGTRERKRGLGIQAATHGHPTPPCVRAACGLISFFLTWALRCLARQHGRIRKWEAN